MCQTERVTQFTVWLPGKWRLSSSTDLSWVQKQQQKRPSYQEGSEVLWQERFQNKEPCCTHRAITGSTQWGWYKSRGGPGTWKEKVGLFQIKITEEDAPDAPFHVTSKVLNNQSTEDRTGILGPKLLSLYWYPKTQGKPGRRKLWLFLRIAGCDHSGGAPPHCREWTCPHVTCKTHQRWNWDENSKAVQAGLARLTVRFT